VLWRIHQLSSRDFLATRRLQVFGMEAIKALLFMLGHDATPLGMEDEGSCTSDDFIPSCTVPGLRVAGFVSHAAFS
jgi:hypothetical protein